LFPRHCRFVIAVSDSRRRFIETGNVFQPGTERDAVFRVRATICAFVMGLKCLITSSA
jgi:hypothetical protein